MSAYNASMMDPSRRRSSITGSRTSLGASALPRPQSRGPTSRMGIRASTTQPTYNLLTGEETTARPPSRDRFRTSLRGPSGEQQRERSVAAETEIETDKRRQEMDALKAEVKKLQYTIDNHKQEEELAKLRHDSEVREARRKGEDDFKKMQVAEGEKARAIRQYESLMKEMTEVKDAASNEKAALERRAREVEESKRVVEEEMEDIQTEREETLRMAERKSSELEARNQTLQQTVEELQQDSDRREALLQQAQQQLAEKDSERGGLEAEIIRLKAQTGDAETLGIIKRELGEQVSHIKKIEAFNRKQAAELDHFRQLHKSIEIVEEEKRSLQRKVDSIEGIRNELGEALIQRQRLEDDRLAWTAYLQSQGADEGEVEFDSPEALAKAFIEERLRTASLMERVGKLESESLEKDGSIQNLESQKSSLTQEVQKLQSAGGSGSSNSGNDSKALSRLERHRDLAKKEVDFLRAQLKTFDAEDTTFQPENVDEAKIKRIEELEGMVDQYRKEIQKLHDDLTAYEAFHDGSLKTTNITGTKRPRDASEESEHLGVLTRKNRKLQDELSVLQTSTGVLQKDLSVARDLLSAATKQSSVRILSLRSNPTTDHEAIKQSTLTALRKENADLLAQLSTRSTRSAPGLIPISTLEASQRDVRDAHLELASEKKHRDRLLKVWRAKTAEIRELNISLLGWDVIFLKNGKTKVTSSFYPKDEEEENSIEFDGERGTMKVSGGPQSKFASRIGEQVKFWVHEKASIPCFLAALTLEFYEESHKGDVTMRVD